MGVLTVSGVLRVKQFWPGARSDADTATVELTAKGKKPFVFVDDAGGRHETHAFDKAEVAGKFGNKPAIKTTKSSPVRKITVRLQGVDSPELHYQPQVTGSKKGVNHPFRQSLGETCANALHDYLTSLGQAEIPCEVVTIVQKPSDVFDVFARVVGNLVLLVGGSRIDVNQWLLREGWALPGLYNSMSRQEILAVMAEHEAAKQHGRGLFSRKIVTKTLAAFDSKRVERKGPASFKPFSDKGAVNFPKFFRRQAEQHVLIASGKPGIPKNLREFIKVKKKDDVALEREKFLKLKGQTTGKKPRPEFKQVAAFITGDRYPTGPELVFWENASKVVKAGTNTEITKW